jgi:hypothetical protein
MSVNRIVVDARSFHIQPEDIDASKHLFGAFGNAETEISAGWIVRFLQVRGQGWVPFSREEIEAFYAQYQKDGFTFNRLIEPEFVPPNLARAFAGFHDTPIPEGGGWIMVGTDEKYRVTDDFVECCYRSSPAKQTA